MISRLMQNNSNAMGIEETKEGNKEHELLYEDSRINVGESLPLTTCTCRLDNFLMFLFALNSYF